MPAKMNTVSDATFLRRVYKLITHRDLLTFALIKLLLIIMFINIYLPIFYINVITFINDATYLFFSQCDLSDVRLCIKFILLCYESYVFGCTLEHGVYTVGECFTENNPAIARDISTKHTCFRSSSCTLCRFSHL